MNGALQAHKTDNRFKIKYNASVHFSITIICGDAYTVKMPSTIDGGGGGGNLRVARKGGR